MKKKASLQISVQAIVVLILAITMLGLGIAFIKNMFGKTTGQLADIGDDIKNQMIDDLKNSDERLKFQKSDIDIRKAEKKKEIYFGVKNELDNDNFFYIGMGCTSVMGDSDGDVSVIEFNVFPETPTIKIDEVEVMKAEFFLTPDAKITSYLCYIAIDPDETTPTPETEGVYEYKNFYVTVK